MEKLSQIRDQTRGRAGSHRLENFVYRIQQGPGPYVLVFASVFVAVSLLIAVQCWKTAAESPVRNLRSE